MTTMISTVMVLLYSQHLVEGRATITFLDISPIAFWSGFADQKYLHGEVASGWWWWWWWWWWTKPQEDPLPLPLLLGPKFLGLAFDLTALSHWVAPLVKNFLDFDIRIQSGRVQVICWLYFQPEKCPSENCQLEWFLIPSGFSPFPIPSCRADIWSVKPPHQQQHHHYHHYYQEGKKGRSSRRELYYTFPIPSYCAEYLGFIRCAKDCWTVETKKIYLKHLPRSEKHKTNSSELYPTNAKISRSLWEWEPVSTELLQPARLYVRVWLQRRLLPLFQWIHLPRSASMFRQDSLFQTTLDNMSASTKS